MTRKPLVGRSSELASLAEALGDLRAGAGALVLLVGEPGIGKSRLAEEVARLAKDDGHRVVWGRAWEAGGAPPYWPWIQILRGVEADVQDPGIAPLLAGRDAAAVSPEDRFLVFDSVARALIAAAGARPTVAILEDLHAADESSLHLLAFLASHLGGAPLFVLGTYRDVEARMTPAAGAVLEKLARTARVIAPRRLAPSEIGELASSIPLDADTLASLHRQSEGNPLFVTELLRVLERRGGSGPVAVPAGIRTAIREHLRGLPQPLPPLLEVAAVIGREFAASTVAELCRRPLDDVLDGLAAAVELGVLVERAPTRFAFAHGLIAETLHHDLPAARRMQLHVEVANTLEHSVDHVSELAHHLFEAGPDQAKRAVEVATRAAEQARRRLAYEAAVSLIERALAIVPPSDLATRFELLRLLADVRFCTDDVTRGREAALEASALARTLGSPDLFARSALTYGGLWTFGSTDRVLVQLLEEALAQLPAGDSQLRARMLARLASALQPARDCATPMAIAREAIAMANRLDDDRTRLEVLFSGIAALVLFAPPAERKPLNLQALALADHFDEPVIALRTRLRLVFDHAEVGDLVGVEEHHRAYDVLVERLRLPRARWPSAMISAMVALVRGNSSEHANALAEAERLAAEAGDSFFATTRVGHGIALASQRGTRAELEAARPLFQTMQGWGRGWAYDEEIVAMHALLGELDQARALLTDELVAAARGHGLLMIAGQLSFAIWKLGDRARAAMLYDWLASEGTRFGILHNHGFALSCPAAHMAMQLAATLGDLDAARRHHDIAARILRSMNARPLEARLERDFATILLAAGVREEGVRRATIARDLAAICDVHLEPLDLGADLGSALGSIPATPTTTSVAALSMRCEGEYWALEGFGTTCRLRTSRGLELLGRLLAEPGRELHALELAGDGEVDTGDSGELLDAEARSAYKTRVVELREELEEAEQWNDTIRAERARNELEAIQAELARAVGLGGRSRRAGRAAERARINVQRRLADVIKRVAEVAPELATHLSLTVRTGAYCSYFPDRVPRSK